MYINNLTAQNAALPTEPSSRQVSQSQLDKGQPVWPHHGVLVTAALPSCALYILTDLWLLDLVEGFGGVWFDILGGVFCLFVWFFLNQKDCIIAQDRWEYQLAVVLGTLGIVLISVKSRESTSVYLSRCFWFLLCQVQGDSRQVRMYQPDTFLMQLRSENSVKWKRSAILPC